MAVPESTSCPECGTRIPRDAPRGLCIACLTGILFVDEPPAAEVPPQEPGGTGGKPRNFGPWRVLGEAGEGAFALVYEALQDRPVRRRGAIKVLKPGLDRDEVLARFALERDALAVLDHPGIARVLDAGSEDGHPWIASEWVEGARTITDYCREAGLALPDKVRLFGQVCDAMAHAHQRGVIHRDLKPGNLLVRADGQVKVIDFGIARATEQVLAGSTLVTMAGQVLGTPAYMSPEQACGHGAEADTRSDVYSLGALLYEILTGHRLFDGPGTPSASLHELLRRVREDEPPRPSAKDPALRGELEWIVLKALEKDPVRRYETAAGLGQDLTAWGEGGPVLAAPPSLAYQGKILFRRHRAAVFGGLGILLALLAGLAATLHMYYQAREQERTARRNGAMAAANAEEARRTASRGDHRTAQMLFDRNQPVTALMHLARAVRTDPDNEAASGRLAGEMLWTDFPRPAHAPVELPEFIRYLNFSPDGRRLAVQGNEVNFGPGFTALYEVGTWSRIGPATLPLTGTHTLDFSPDGTVLAVGQHTGGVSFWSAGDGTRAAARPGLPHQRAIYSVQWITPDRLATVEDTGEKDSTGRLWDLTSRTVLSVVKALPTLAVPALSPDRRLMAWVDSGGTVRVIAAADGRPVSSWKSPGEGTAAFVGNETLAVQTFAEKLRLYRISDGAGVGQPMQSSSFALTPQPSPDGSFIITAGFDGIATSWDTQSQKPVRQFDGRFLFARFAAGGSGFVLGGGGQQEVQLWQADGRKESRAPVPVAGGAMALGLSPDGRWLACGGRSRSLTLYDLRSRAARPMILTFPGGLWHAAWNASGTRLAALGVEGSSAVWLADGTPDPARPAWQQAVAIAAPPSHASGLRRGHALQSISPRLADMLPPGWLPDGTVSVPGCAAISPDGGWLAVGSAVSGIQLRHLRTPAAGVVRVSLTSAPCGLAFAPDGATAAAGLADGRVVRIDLTSGRPTGSWAAHAGAVSVLTFLPDGRTVSASDDGGIALSPSGMAVAVASPVRQIAVSGDGRWFATGHLDASAQLWDARTGQPAGRAMRHTSVVGPAGLLLRFSADGTLLATAGSHDDTVRLWGVPDGVARAVLPHPHRVNDFVFDPGGHRLATLAGEGERCALQLWDTASALPLMPSCPLPSGDGALSLAMRPDGNQVAVASWRGAVFVYDLPPRLIPAPAWLPAAAEAHTGWKFDAAGLPVSGLFPAMPPGTDPWSRWLAADPAKRTISPLSPQTLPQYLTALEGLSRGIVPTEGALPPTARPKDSFRRWLENLTGFFTR